MNLNQVNLIGRVGGDPEVKSLPSGGLVCSFSIATNRTWTKDGKKHEQTEWHNVTFFGDNLIEKVIEPYVKRGSEVYVGGRLQTRSWEKDGQKHYRTEILGEQIQLGSRPQGGEGGDARPARSERRVPKTLEEQQANEREDSGIDFPEEEQDHGTPPARATKGRKEPARSPDDIRPEDIPF